MWKVPHRIYSHPIHCPFHLESYDIAFPEMEKSIEGVPLELGSYPLMSSEHGYPANNSHVHPLSIPNEKPLVSQLLISSFLWGHHVEVQAHVGEDEGAEKLIVPHDISFHESERKRKGTSRVPISAMCKFAWFVISKAEKSSFNEHEMRWKVYISRIPEATGNEINDRCNKNGVSSFLDKNPQGIIVMLRSILFRFGKLFLLPKQRILLRTY